MSVFFEVGQFYEEGAFFESLVVAPPAIIDIGSPGDPIHALPFRALGGSVADLDMLYGVLGATDAQQDIQPIFTLATRSGLIRAFGFEVPRQGILDVVAEAYATLIEVEDCIIEANPAGPNLFGSVALTTRPMSTVTLDNSDGYWTALDERELLIGAPAGLLWDVAHQVLVPELVGVVSAVVIDGPRATLTFGHAARKTNAPNITD